jgi:D-serine deaminase-like pyridoxal phosphate-dependent protein
MNIDDIDTPAVIIDLDKVAANLAAAQNYADQHGLALRPHVKTHKLARFAQDQIGLGAIGITAQKIGRGGRHGKWRYQRYILALQHSRGSKTEPAFGAA